MVLAAQLPGIYFQTEVPQPDEALPRMDIAAFVGFATAGPLDLPIPVEDVGRFRELFGPDPVLAWDGERDRLVRGYLGAAVESFFRNGGRRCWVVRVGDASAHRFAFALPGLEDAVTGAPAVARARSPGSWASDLRVATVLQSARLGLETSSDGASSFRLPGQRWELDLSVAPAELARGDLVELSFDGRQVVAYLFLDEIRSTVRGLTVEGERVFWFTEASPSGRSPMSAAEGQGFAQDWASAGGLPPIARRLSFTALVFRRKGLEHRFPGLTFSDRHPRFWGHLPGDADLFRLIQGRKDPVRTALQRAFREEANNPRFPLAGPPQPSGSGLFLPLDMPSIPSLADSSGAASGAPDGELALNGLGHFSAGLFLDPDLAGVGDRALLAQAEHKYYLREQPLRGLYSLLPVEEVTLVAVPDAAHRPWNQDPPPAGDPLGAPDLRPIPDPDEFGRYLLTWSSVEGATRYLLQRDESGDFPTPVAMYDGAETQVHTFLPALCRRPWAFRVRAFRHGEASPWSRTRIRTLPPRSFADCDAAEHPDLLLEWHPGSPEGFFSWSGLEESLPSPPSDHTFELERAGDSDFLSAETIFSGWGTEHPQAEPLDAPDLFRVRAVQGEARGPWSNTVRLDPVARSAHTLVTEEDFDLEGRDGDLLAIHRALLRFCAARADLLSILSLPRHYRREQALRHVTSLLPADDSPPPPAITTGEAPRVPPLTRGERRVVGYGALYHAWLAAAPEERAVGAAGGELRFVPADGTVAGLMARRALDRGAWHAPANEPFAGALALDPPLTLDDWSALAEAPVNVLRQDPRGFLVLGADTLSRERSLRPINVRRLLILLRRLALREGRSDVFEPNDADFRSHVRHRFERMLSDLYVRGAFAGATPEAAFRVVADGSLNPLPSIEQGRFIVELRVAPSHPLAFLTVRLVQTGPEHLVLEEL